MTAYGAVNSLRNTIDYILHSSYFNLVEPSPQIIQLAYNELDPLQEILERLDRTRTSKSRKKVNALDGRIKELIWEFQDLLESLLYHQIFSQFHADQVYEEMKSRVQGFLESLPSQPQILFQSPPPHHTTTRTQRVLHYFKPKRLLHYFKPKGRKFIAPRFSIDLQFLQHEVPSFIQRLKDMEEEYIYEVQNMPEDDDDESISTRTRTKSMMIGLSDQLEQLKDYMMMSYDNRLVTVGIVGTAGVGKTALAEAVFEDPDILSHFEHRVWVRVGKKSQFDDVSREILAQMFRISQGDHELGACFKERLQARNCLIVLDDVWERQIMDSLLSSLQNINNGSIRILGTTRDRNTNVSMDWILVRFLNEEESKELLCQKVFGEKDCPFQLDKAATKIAKNCEGLPLTIVTVADILSKSHNTDPKYWEDVAEMRNSVFTDAYNEISKVLYPSYEYLPQYLKMPFLYMGVFPPDYDIPISKIMNMLATEGWFHNTQKKQSLEDSVWKCLKELCVNASICTILKLFRRVPCLKKLGVHIELTPYDDHNDLLRCVGHISTLGSLETLKYSIINPVVKYDYAFRSSLMKLPRRLKKLHLSGMGFPWNYMDVIGSLPLLEVLKLRAYAFRGSKWEAQETSFLKLKFLLIEDSDLVQWKPRSGSFPNLMYLSMKHCYKLEEIHWLFHYRFGTIELVNCNPVALTWLKQLRPDPFTMIDVTATYSFDEKPVTIKFRRYCNC
ncbi:putative disease resistance RPP13-like protein 2 [Salvia miltiorrhiza]|uniref:putative disease resistance RPP13-like protein 2 n=1 Tax=Salvia miltiorrhiza TaxID=226208 RepID=UPI0025AD73D4|nr:putative disease resistance RPP13-like protein 2 [Salvia miltiorrhiza]